ncbi:MAG: hypothetical protein JWP02_52 [Acidimicrobiales bacterium]|nr:hypothetical protein [Acidimicrobiales bacterium]
MGPHLSRNDRPLVSLTTVPWRGRFLGAVLDSLMAQTCTDVDVHLFIPAACARTNEAYVLPDKLLARAASEPRLSIRRIPTDYGPATKLLAPYEERLSGDGRHGPIITVDDDVLLEAHAIEELLEAHARHPDDALGFMGASDGRFVHAEQLAARGVDHTPAAILGGYRGVLYPGSALDVSLLEDFEAVSGRVHPFLADDHLVGWNLARRGRVRRVIATRHAPPTGALNIGFLDLPGPITGGPDGDQGIDRSHRCLIEYYEERGWPWPR